MGVNREDTIKDLFKSFTGQDYQHGMQLDESVYDRNAGVLKSGIDGAIYKDDEINEAAAYFEEKAKEFLTNPETKRVGEFYRIGYEAIAIMKGRIGSSGV